MNVNFNGFNMGQNPFEEIQRTCANHFACVNCPVLNNDGLHGNNSVTICDKIADKFYRDINNGNSKV